MDISFTVLLHYSSIYIYIGALVTFLIDLGLRRMNNSGVSIPKHVRTTP